MSKRRLDIDWEKLEREVFGGRGEVEGLEDRRRAESFSREADEIVDLILTFDMPKVDVEIRIRSFRERVLEEFPEKAALFEAVYIGRFRRIWEQFRREGRLLDGDER